MFDHQDTNLTIKQLRAKQTPDARGLADMLGEVQVGPKVVWRLEEELTGVAADPDLGDDVVVLLVGVLAILVASVKHI